MPELPEVETVRKVLIEWMKGRKIRLVRVIYPMIIENVDKDEFISSLTNATIDDIGRLGKHLVFKLGDYRLVSHLRMEGKYYRVNSVEEYNNSIYYRKHTHLLFYLSDGSIILYHDVRKFGRFNLYKSEDEMNNSKLISKLGLEPFDVKDGSYIYNKLSSLPKSLTLKELLLDQTILLGIGNIYADEICFDCKLYPFLNVHELTKDDCDKIIVSSRKILEKAIILGGSTVHSFSFANGVDGKFQEALQVYGREGERCNECGQIITKIRLGGRGTCFCSYCQTSHKVSPRVIGVTGLIGSGKSHVCKDFEKFGYKILDADKLAHDCYIKGSKTYEMIVKLFGKKILKIDNEIDINNVRDLVKNDKEKLSKLEEIIHPEVVNIIKKEIQNKKQKYVLDVPLLFESKLNKLCDNVTFVYANEKVRQQRIVSRNTMNLDDSKYFNSNLEDAYKKIKMSDFVVNNSGNVEETYKQVRKIIENK